MIEDVKTASDIHITHKLPSESLQNLIAKHCRCCDFSKHFYDDDIEKILNNAIATEQVTTLTRVLVLIKGMKDYKNGKPEQNPEYQCTCGYSFDDCTCEHNQALDDLEVKVQAILKDYEV